MSPYRKCDFVFVRVYVSIEKSICQQKNIFFLKKDWGRVLKLFIDAVLKTQEKTFGLYCRRTNFLCTDFSQKI